MLNKLQNADTYGLDAGLLAQLSTDPVATLAEMEANYQSKLLTADDFELADLEFEISEARAKIARDTKRTGAANALKLADEAKAKQATAKMHLDAGKVIAREIQTKLNKFNEFSAQLVGISKELEALQQGMNKEMMQAKHHGGGEHINFDKLSIDPVIASIRVISSVAHRGFFNG